MEGQREACRDLTLLSLRRCSARCGGELVFFCDSRRTRAVRTADVRRFTVSWHHKLCLCCWNSKSVVFDKLHTTNEPNKLFSTGQTFSLYWKTWIIVENYYLKMFFSTEQNIFSLWESLKDRTRKEITKKFTVFQDKYSKNKEIKTVSGLLYESLGCRESVLFWSVFSPTTEDE